MRKDRTAEAAISQVAASALITAMETLELRQRALVFAHVGLQMTVQTLAREFNITVQEATQQIDDGLAQLRTADDIEALSGIHRLGERGSFLDHAHRLQLSSWFCRNFGRFQVQKGIGRPRVTCSDTCRYELHRSRHSTRWRSAL